jgi:hypothetical protein
MNEKGKPSERNMIESKRRDEGRNTEIRIKRRHSVISVVRLVRTNGRREKGRKYSHLAVLGEASNMVTPITDLE